MCALSEIRAAITEKRATQPSTPLFQRRLKIQVGLSAQLSIIASTHDHQLPIFIDHCAVEKVTEFKGWEIMEI